MQVKAEVAERWFAAAGRNLEEVQAEIDKDLKPRSFALPATLRVEAKLDLERAVRTVHNVAAYLPGETDEYIVIGAHYDHLGLGEQFSMAPSQAGTVHPGRRRQRLRHRRRDRTGALVRPPAEAPARHSVPDLRGRGTGAARLQLLREPPRAAARTRPWP